MADKLRDTLKNLLAAFKCRTVEITENYDQDKQCTSATQNKPSDETNHLEAELKKMAREFKDEVNGGVDAFVEATLSNRPTLNSASEEKIKEYNESIKKVTSNISEIRNWFSSLLTRISDIISSIGNWIRTKISNIKQKITEAFNGLPDP